MNIYKKMKNLNKTRIKNVKIVNSIKQNLLTINQDQINKMN